MGDILASWAMIVCEEGGTMPHVAIKKTVRRPYQAYGRCGEVL